jgi:hypothetical protein
MEAGFSVEYGHYDVNRVLRWIPGDPERGWIGEAKRAQLKDGVKIRTFRCPECGYLESYAPTESEAEA